MTSSRCSASISTPPPAASPTSAPTTTPRYVRTQEGSDWVPTLVIFKLNPAALCV
ncbi:hypothetical protein BDA96_05G163900 [Sorghum bicolor]|uniref:Uncharacterized protein n=2 Tax=Sorghum bicolor TaxID=4558 RepID=A0A921UFX5_SORBI|nr:hypothetical protein BDA96_05G163900 [Sorghum bicolor]KXG28666.1 hypothetical protein SORBI_3005G150300 [Sorghum bicolor]